MHHYVYYSYEQWGRGYIGVRSCKCLPEQDSSYFGSFSDEKFHPTEKIVLCVFSTREEALTAEVVLHEFYEIHLNPHFANRARQLTTSFCTAGKPGPWLGKKQSESHRRKHAETLRGHRHSEETKKKIGLKSKGNKYRLGKTLTDAQKEHLRKVNTGKTMSPEARQKIAESKRGKPCKEETKEKIRAKRLGQNLTEEHKKRISECLKARFSSKDQKQYGGES